MFYLFALLGVVEKGVLFARVAMVKYILFVCDARSDRQNCLFGRSEVKCVLFG